MTDMSDNTASRDRERQLIAAAEKDASQFADSPAPLLPPLDAIPGYKIRREIGHGGMGAVYEAVQEGTKRNVAVKVMLAGPFASPAARLRFDREVELAARLQHPAIVRVLESNLLPTGQRYYAMDLVKGVTLDRYVAREKPDVRVILEFFVELCAAVEHAHQHGVIHRDLKPANVLVDAEGKPHILDFGLAKATDQEDSTAMLAAEVSSPGQVVGTLRYLSPEQAAGRTEQIDARTDVYALAVGLFEALTGSMPYDTTGHPSTVIQRILEQPPARPSSLSDRVDGELETIILKALEKEKARRYQSVREMGEDLGRYLRGEAILAKPPSRLYRLRKKLSRHRRRIVFSLAASALVLVGLTVALSWRHQALEANSSDQLTDIELRARRKKYEYVIERCAELLKSDRRAQESVRIYHLRGTVYLCLRECDKAVDDFTKASQMVDTELSKSWSLYPRATALWMAGDREKAAADYRRFHLAYPGHLYSQARLFLVLRDQARRLEKEGRTVEAEQTVEEANDVLDEALHAVVPGSWLEKILACLSGERAPSAIVDDATDSANREQLCEAYYYAGEACLLAGEARQARDWFGKCVAMDMPIDEDAEGTVPMNEWHLARWRLDQLSAEDTGPTSQPPRA